jgi:PAS domain S-box-containing protein
MPWVEAVSDLQQLRRCIRDLVALSTLPALWRFYGPEQIADSIAAALVSMLDADFVYVVLPGKHDEPETEVTRTGARARTFSAADIRAWLHDVRQRQSYDQPVEIPAPSGAGTVQLAFAPIGFGGHAVLVAGSSAPSFPTPEHRLLLGIGASEATIAIQRWQSEADERRLVTLVERSSDFIGVATIEGRPQYINAAGMNLVGLRGIEEASKFHVIDFVAPEDRARARDSLWGIVMKEGRWSGELAFRHFQSGESLPALVDWFRIDDPRSGKPMNVATVTRDLRSLKQVEDELRRMNETLEERVAERTFELRSTNDLLMMEIAERERAVARQQELQLELFHAARLSAVGQMAGALAHELNQPLTAVTNSVNAARRRLAMKGKNTSDAIAAVMGEAAEHALRAGQIVRRMRTFVTYGDVEMRIEDVTKLVEEASALAMTGVGSQGVAPRFAFDRNATHVFADRTQIQQVLVNLIRNAVEAMADSARRELVVLTRLHDAKTVEISVSDSGPGVAREILQHLFEPFHSTKRDGMGLGLSICRSIVEAHGGRLRCSENPGGGTIFRFTLSAAPADGESSAA